jgi:hypothetical protein
VIDQALKLARAGYAIDAAELSEKTGYRLALRNFPIAPLPDAPTREKETEAEPTLNEI